MSSSKNKVVDGNDKKNNTGVKWLIRINLVVFCIMIFLLILMLYDKSHNKRVDGADIETSEASIDKKIDDGMSNLYMSALTGRSYKLDGNMVMSFAEDGNYSGFFDKDHKSVAGFFYDILPDKETGDYMLNIYNEDKSSKVSYVLDFDDDYNLTLTYPGSKGSFVLSQENFTAVAD